MSNEDCAPKPPKYKCCAQYNTEVVDKLLGSLLGRLLGRLLGKVLGNLLGRLLGRLAHPRIPECERCIQIYSIMFSVFLKVTKGEEGNPPYRRRRPLKAHEGP